MSDLEHLSQLIGNMQKADDQTLKESQKYLKKLREKDIDQYINTFTNLLKSEIHFLHHH